MATVEAPEARWGSARSRSSTGCSTSGRAVSGSTRSATRRSGSGAASRRPRTASARCKTVDLASAGYPLSFAFHGAAKGINPYINILNRLVIVQFEDFEGNLKTLAWEPTIAEGAAEAPFYDQLLKRYGEFLSYKVFATFYNTVEEAIAKCGLTPADIDYVSFDHLHVQDLRLIMGTTRPVQGESEPRKPFFPNAKFLFQRKEVDTFKSPHPTQWAWYVPGGMDDVIEDNLVLLDGDVELGKGVAIVCDARPHGRQPQPRGQHRRRRVGHLRERRVRRLVAPAPVEDPGHPQVRRVLQPRGRDEREHARGLDRPVRLDGEGEGDRRPEPARPALAERLPVVGDAGLAPPVAGAADVHLRRDELRDDHEAARARTAPAAKRGCGRRPRRCCRRGRARRRRSSWGGRSRACPARRCPSRRLRARRRGRHRRSHDPRP